MPKGLENLSVLPTLSLFSIYSEPALMPRSINPIVSKIRKK